MREARSWRWHAGVASLALLITLASSALAIASASRDGVAPTAVDTAASTTAAIVFVAGAGEISIDDDTVVPGQRVTITAGGFAQDDAVDVFVDSNPLEGDESGWLATAETNSVGSAVITVRLPRDLSPGAHTLFVAGWGPEHLSPQALSVDISVLANATTPPTDTD